MGQPVNESYRIRQKKIPVIPRTNPAYRGIQRGKKHVLFHNLFLFVFHIGIQHPVHDRGFPGIGIAHQGYGGQIAFPAFFALGLPVLFDGVQIFFKFADPFLYPPAIQFQFLLPGALIGKSAPGPKTSSGPGAAALPGQRLPHAHKPWQHILQIGAFHLQARFLCFCPPVKYFQNQVCPVQHGHFHFLLEVALLGRAQRIVKHHIRRPRHGYQILDFLRFPASDVKRVIRRRKILYCPGRHLHVARLYQTLQFLHGTFKIRIVIQIHPSQNYLFHTASSSPLSYTASYHSFPVSSKINMPRSKARKQAGGDGAFPWPCLKPVAINFESVIILMHHGDGPFIKCSVTPVRTIDFTNGEKKT